MKQVPRVFVRGEVGAGEGLAGDGVAEGKLPRPERRAALLVPRAVAPVAEQRQTARGELHADLVRAPGVQPDAHERECVRAPELLIGQARLAHALAHAADDIALVALCVTEEEIRQRVRGRLRVPGQDGEVLLFHLPLGDKAGELSRDGRAARVDHHAADLAVEPVDGEDLLALPERAVVLAQQLRHAARRAVVLRENARGLDADDEVRVVIENGECFHRRHNQRRPRPR